MVVISFTITQATQLFFVGTGYWADSGAQKTNNKSYYSGVIILPIPILSAQTMHYRKEITTDSVVWIPPKTDNLMISGLLVRLPVCHDLCIKWMGNGGDLMQPASKFNRDPWDFFWEEPN